MKKSLFALCALSLFLAPLGAFASGPSTPKNAIGRILLQVEERGEAWYVDPVTEARYYLKDGPLAYQALREFGLGITTKDLLGIPIGGQEYGGYDSDGDGLEDKFEEAIGTDGAKMDTDGDGFHDGLEISNGYNPFGKGKQVVNTALVNRVKGRILLQVEDRGQAWYVNPVDGKRYYMRNGDAAYFIMRYMGLGATNATLGAIPLHARHEAVVECGDDSECLQAHLKALSYVHYATDDITLESSEYRGILEEVSEGAGEGSWKIGLDVSLRKFVGQTNMGTEYTYNMTVNSSGYEDGVLVEDSRQIVTCYMTRSMAAEFFSAMDIEAALLSEDNGCQYQALSFPVGG